MRASHRHGFTLIELSIVLVIIGLLVGGILVGRDLIRMAELRGDIREIEKFDAAVNTFRLKYNCIPGDCANATQFLAGAHNGNGNGLIEAEVYSDGTMTVRGDFLGFETAYAIDQLARAQLIAVEPFESNMVGDTDEDYLNTRMPQLPYGRAFVVRPELIEVNEEDNAYGATGKHTYRLGTNRDSGSFSGMTSTTPAPYTPSDAFWIDSKIDDGNADVGRVTVAGENLPADDAAFRTVDALFYAGVCAHGGPGSGLTADTCQYDPTVKDKRIGLFVRANF